MHQIWPGVHQEVLPPIRKWGISDLAAFMVLAVRVNSGHQRTGRFYGRMS